MGYKENEDRLLETMNNYVKEIKNLKSQLESAVEANKRSYPSHSQIKF